MRRSTVQIPRNDLTTPLAQRAREMRNTNQNFLFSFPQQQPHTCPWTLNALDTHGNGKCTEKCKLGLEGKGKTDKVTNQTRETCDNSWDIVASAESRTSAQRWLVEIFERSR